jgi:hypothetical protein
MMNLEKFEGSGCVVLRFYPRICPEDLKKSSKTLDEDSWCPTRDSKGVPPGKNLEHYL